VTRRQGGTFSSRYRSNGYAHQKITPIGTEYQNLGKPFLCGQLRLFQVVQSGHVIPGHSPKTVRQ
ncbi:hypothetical protein, partial [Pseudomonas kilonensis]|uniref:hypothetical protein n=1 Tax=Pseudomonas kilonensis TaxID=132476 RepID=UPI001C8FA416